MTKFVIEHDRPNCIGCGSCCVIADKFWELDDEGKSKLIKGTRRENGKEMQEIEEKDLEVVKDAAESCPVTVIHLREKETGKELI